MIVLIFTSCVSQYKVVVDFSPELRDHFVEYPTIEVDIAAVTDDEADEVKQMGVEQYFAPGSGTREQLQVQTCLFYRDARYTFVLPSRAPIWQTWRLKDPTTLLVIASLPHDPSMSAQADPRLLAITMKRSYILARSMYVWVEPTRITQVARSSGGRESAAGASPASAQWVETREIR